MPLKIVFHGSYSAPFVGLRHITTDANGDAVVDIAGVSQKVAPTSTLCNTFAINILMMNAVKKLSEKGIDPPLWMSANLPGGDARNKALEEKYFPRVKHLM